MHLDVPAKVINPAVPGPVTLQSCWLAETIRLREEHWGPLADADEVRQVRRMNGNATTRVLLRARLLGQREHLDTLVARWQTGAVTALSVLVIVAAIAGAGTALGALGDGSRPVNVLWALGALLGLHALTFIVWLLAFVIPAGSASTGLGRVWLWITRKVAHGPDSALVPQALMNLLARSGSLRWLFGCVSHLIWLVALAAALLAMLTVLSTARYHFIWATTLLDPERFVQLTRVLGWLPSHLGFGLPDPAAVLQSDGSQPLPAAVQVQWSVWLIGLVVVYGILPRLLAWLLSVAMMLAARKRLRPDLQLPGYAGLADRLSPDAPSVNEYAARAAPHEPRIATGLVNLNGRSGAVMLALELPDDLAWPPARRTPSSPDAGAADAGAAHAAAGHAGMGHTAAADTGTADACAAHAASAPITDAGNLDSRLQRNQVLDALAETPATRLLIACDARQTPDRGTLALIAELSAKAGQTAVWLMRNDPPGAPLREAQWTRRLQDAGMAPGVIWCDADNAFAWLEAKV
jgi:hypothetical protein